MKRLSAGAAALLLALLVIAPLTGPQADLRAQTINLLLNPGFEDGFSPRGAGEVVVGNGWFPWWVQGTPDQTDVGYLRRPEYKPEDGRRFGYRRIHGGDFGQKFFTTYSTHVAGIYQQVAVPRGYRLTFSIWVQVWSSSGDDPDDIVDHGDYKVSVGIDPRGGIDGHRHLLQDPKGQCRASREVRPHGGQYRDQLGQGVPGCHQV
jgi:hypothetical protein